MLSRARQVFSRRPFPSNMHALRSCRVSYSQYGEDLFLTSLLGYEKTDGVFVDIGCYHPIEFSNTYIFHQRGWRGLAIDPNPAWADAWAKYRPGDRFVNAAATAEAGEALYLMDSRYPAMNRLVDQQPTEGLSAGQTLVTVPTLRLETMLAQWLPGAGIDLMNIDCEGHDLSVLESLDFSKVRPRVIAVEDLSLQPDAPVAQFLQDRDYACKATIGITKIFEAR